MIWHTDAGCLAGSFFLSPKEQHDCYLSRAGLETAMCSNHFKSSTESCSLKEFQDYDLIWKGRFGKVCVFLETTYPLICPAHRRIEGFFNTHLISSTCYLGLGDFSIGLGRYQGRTLFHRCISNCHLKHHPGAFQSIFLHVHHAMLLANALD